jgi:hypothetical protein
MKIVSEVLSILSIATKEVKRKRASKSFLQALLRSFRCSCFVRNVFQKTIGKDRSRGRIGGARKAKADERGGPDGHTSHYRCATCPTTRPIYADLLSAQCSRQSTIKQHVRDLLLSSLVCLWELEFDRRGLD